MSVDWKVNTFTNKRVERTKECYTSFIVSHHPWRYWLAKPRKLFSPCEQFKMSLLHIYHRLCLSVYMLNLSYFNFRQFLLFTVLSSHTRHETYFLNYSAVLACIIWFWLQLLLKKDKLLIEKFEIVFYNVFVRQTIYNHILTILMVSLMFIIKMSNTAMFIMTTVEYLVS